MIRRWIGLFQFLLHLLYIVDKSTEIRDRIKFGKYHNLTKNIVLTLMTSIKSIKIDKKKK